MRSRRASSSAILLILLTACGVAPVEQRPTPTAEPQISVIDPPAPTQTPRPAPTATVAPTQTPEPTATATPQPTQTLTPEPLTQPVVSISAPTAGEFVTSAMIVMGEVAHVTGGVVLLRLISTENQPLAGNPVVAETTPMSDGLSFRGEISIELPPTPRRAIVQALWAATEGAEPTASGGRSVNLLGRYPRVAQIVVESPAPLERGTEPQIAVRGIAPGPPARVVARLLDEADNVLDSADATLSWVQPGLPCTFTTVLPNNPAATKLQVLAFAADGSVIEEARVRLEIRR